MPDNEMKVVISAQNDQLRTGLDGAVSQVNAACSEMLGHFKSFESTMGSLSSVITSHLGAIATGLSAALIVDEIRKSVDAFEAYAGSVRQLSNTLGITAEQASLLTTSLRIAGLSNEEYIGAAVRMERQIRSDEEKFKHLGVAVRETSGAYRPMTAVLDDVVEKMKSFKAGQDQMLYAMDALGPRGAELAFKLIKLKEATEVAIPLMRELGIEMGQRGKDAAHQYEMQVNALGVVWDALKIKIGSELIPALTDLMKVLVQISVPVVNALVDGFKGIISACTAVGGAAQVMGAAVLSTLVAISDILSGIVHAAVLAFKGDWSGAWDAMKGGVLDAKEALQAGGEVMVESATDTYQRIKSLWTTSPMTGAAPTTSSGTESYTPYKKETFKSRVPEWKADLEQIAMEEKAYYGLGTDRERTFWEDRLKATSRGGKEQIKERNEVLAEIWKAEVKGYKDSIAEQEEWLKAEEGNERNSWENRLAANKARLDIIENSQGKESLAYQKAYVEGQKLAEAQALQERELATRVLSTQVKAQDDAAAMRVKDAQHRLDMGQITATQEIALERSSEEQRYAIERNLMEQEADLWKEQPLKYQEMLDKIQLAKAAHDDRMTELSNKADLENKKIVEQLFAPIQSAISTSIRGIIQGTTSLADAMRNIFQSILLSFIDMCTQMLEKWIATQMTMAAFGQGGGGGGGPFSMFSGLLGSLFGGGGSALVPQAALSGTGFEGALMTVGEAAMMAFEGGSWEVPKNQVSLVHAGEMILPPEMAEAVRRGAGFGGGTTVNNITAMDGADVYRTLRRHSNPAVSALSRSFRDMQITAMGRK